MHNCSSWFVNVLIKVTSSSFKRWFHSVRGFPHSLRHFCRTWMSSSDIVCLVPSWSACSPPSVRWSAVLYFKRPPYSRYAYHFTLSFSPEYVFHFIFIFSFTVAIGIRRCLHLILYSFFSLYPFLEPEVLFSVSCFHDTPSHYNSVIVCFLLWISKIVWLSVKLMFEKLKTKQYEHTYMTNCCTHRFT